MAKDENKESEIRGDEQEIVDQRLPVWRPQDADREYYRYETKKRIQHYTVPPQTIFRPAKPTPTIRDAEHMLSENKKRMVVAICAEEEISSIEWARLKKDKWVNRSISCPEYVQSIYKMMNWNKECRYKIYGRLANSERGLVLVFDLASAVMFDPLPEEYFDKHTGKMKKRIVKYYPDEIRMKLGRSYSDYEALQQRSSFESLSGYMDTSGGAVPATVSEELAASISMQEQEKKRETLFGTIIGNGGDDDVRNNE